MKTLSAHKTRSIIEQTITENFLNGSTLSITDALTKLHAVQVNDNTFMLYGCKITVVKNNRSYKVTANKSLEGETMTTTTNELKTMCENIREELTILYNAEFTDEEIEEMQNNGDATSLYDYFTDVLDYEFTINADRTYKAVKIWVTLGGPNICIDTNYNEIRGFWGSDRESAWLPSEIAEEIDSIFEELYNC